MPLVVGMPLNRLDAPVRLAPVVEPLIIIIPGPSLKFKAIGGRTLADYSCILFCFMSDGGGRFPPGAKKSIF